jgi:hypothetical protein
MSLNVFEVSVLAGETAPFKLRACVIRKFSYSSRARVVVGAIIGGVAWYQATLTPFTLHVTTRPVTPPGQQETLQAIPGQRCILLITAVDEGDGGTSTPITLSATELNGLATVAVHPQTITPRQITEVNVTPSLASINQVITVIITGARSGLTREMTVMIEVLPGEDELEEYATAMRDRLIPWLASNHPELDITTDTTWTGTIVNPRILVVMHYIFLSAKWELYVTWHVTIPPYDWTRIYLRHRFAETRPSNAFEIFSVTNQETPRPIDVPDWV